MMPPALLSCRLSDRGLPRDLVLKQHCKLKINLTVTREGGNQIATGKSVVEIGWGLNDDAVEVILDNVVLMGL
ncbi:hypothetical protein L1987_19579 [Smallanthus sonchifolius]|uniref:Uncharacterized protein n=1 Tax=Smallanthus sonchifolius TaxID=185202 RepID=A0ACB9IPV7_9ASTR|nr:hypothetical protein L1987_19579 [Smallanthus sonchifolius]